MPDIEATKEIFSELEFRRLTENFVKTFSSATDSTPETSLKSEKPVKETSSKETFNGQFDLFATPGTGNVSREESVLGFKTIQNTDHFYQHVNTATSRKLFLKKLQQQTSFCFDTETLFRIRHHLNKSSMPKYG